MFPFTVTYKEYFNQIDQNDKQKVIDYLSSYVEKNNGKGILIADGQLSFKISFFGWSWDKFAQIEKGVFTLSDTAISFKFYMYRLILIVVCMSLAVAVGTQETWLGVFSFVILGAGNWITALIKYNQMTKAVAERINKLMKEKASANTGLLQHGLLKMF